MAVHSKPKPLMELVGQRDCGDVLHPDCRSCFGATAAVLRSALVGSGQFFLPVYAAQLLLRGCKPNKQFLLSATRALLRSYTFGVTLPTAIFSFHCLLRWLLGGYRRSTVLFWPTALAGLSAYIEDDSRKSVESFYFCTWVVEWLFRRLVSSRPSLGSRSSLTLAFMLSSACVMGMLHKYNSRKVPIFWFFRPTNQLRDLEDAGVCPHEGPCWKDIVTTSIKYLTAGVALQSARTLLSHLRHPKSKGGLMVTLLAPSNHLLGCFLGAYVAIYKTVTCWLRNSSGRDTQWQAGVAGMLAGLSFSLHPDLTIGLTAATTALQLLLSGALRGRRLREPLFALSLAILVCAYFTDRQHCPPGAAAIIDLVTSNLTVGIYRRLHGV